VDGVAQALKEKGPQAGRFKVFFYGIAAGRMNRPRILLFLEPNARHRTAFDTSEKCYLIS
jgi:hypothetical protein